MKFWLWLFLFFTSCNQPTLSVFTEYISIESLPSYQIDTPDPRLYFPDYGEKIHINWSLPETCIGDTKLHLKIQFGNGAELEEWIALDSPSGTFIYALLNEDYWEKEGVFTFKVDLYSGEKLIKEWRHQLFAERIHLNPQ